MGTVRTDEFRKDAVRIALTSGLTRRQVADDLGVGFSTLNKWVTAHRDTDVVSPEDLTPASAMMRLRIGDRGDHPTAQECRPPGNRQLRAPAPVTKSSGPSDISAPRSGDDGAIPTGPGDGCLSTSRAILTA